MKTNKIKQAILFIIILPLMALNYQKEEDGTNENAKDITNWKWELKSVTSGNKILTPQEKEYFADNAYILEFTSDSTFWLNTSINLAGGSYIIVKEGVISISNYHEFTAVGTTDDYERELNDSLINIFNKVTTYQVLDNTLTFKDKTGEVAFDKSSQVDFIDINNDFRNNIILFPSPTYNKIYFKSRSPNFINKSFKIYNCSGKEMYSGNINNEQSIDISSLLPRIYIIKVGKENYLVQKFVKK